MTWLTTWTAPGSPFPDYAEHATEAEAEQVEAEREKNRQRRLTTAGAR